MFAAVYVDQDQRPSRRRNTHTDGGEPDQLLANYNEQARRANFASDRGPDPQHRVYYSCVIEEYHDVPGSSWQASGDGARDRQAPVVATNIFRHE